MIQDWGHLPCPLYRGHDEWAVVTFSCSVWVLTAGGTASHFSSRPRVPLGEADSWGRGEGKARAGHQKSPFGLVAPIAVGSCNPSSSQARARLPSPLVLQWYWVPGTVTYSAVRLVRILVLSKGDRQ